MARLPSFVLLRRAGALVTVVAASLAPSVTLAGTAAAASTPSVTTLVAKVVANMKTVPAIQVSGTASGMKVHGTYVAHPESSEFSLSGTLKGSTIEISMLEIGKKNWMKANKTGWELFTLGLAPKSTIAKLSPTTWYVGTGTMRVDLGDSLCPTTSSTSSTSSTCKLKGAKLVSYSPSKAVITATSPKETITLESVRGKLLPASIVARGSKGVTENLSYPASAPKITAPVGAKPFPTAH